MYYSEFGLDRYIKHNYFQNNSYSGIIVEVGAAHPSFMSNSKYFRDNNWRSICVEPNPKFVQQHRDHGSEIYPYACANYNGISTFVISNGTWAEEFSGMSFSAIQIRYDISRYNHTHTVIGVNVITLDTLMESLKIDSIDILSIDVCGWELEVMEGFDTNRYEPKIIILDNLNHNKKYEEYMHQQGYIRKIKLGSNYIYEKFVHK